MMNFKRLLGHNFVRDNIDKPILIILGFFFGAIVNNLPLLKSKLDDETTKGIQGWAYTVLDELFPYNVTYVVLFIILLLLICLKRYNKKIQRKYIVMKLLSYGEGYYEVDKRGIHCNDYEEKENIDVSSHFEEKSDTISAGLALKKINEEILVIKKEILKNKNTTYGFLGVAHTPFIFYFGYKIGDAVEIELFHKARDKKKYKQLKDTKEKIPELKLKYEDMKENSKELILVFASTYSIDLRYIEPIKKENTSVIYFETNNMGTDVLNSKTIIDNYGKFLRDEITSIYVGRDIQRVHFILSTSVAMTFKIGQLIADNIDPEIRVYHYDKNSEIKYPWYVNIKESKIGITNTNIQ